MFSSPQEIIYYCYKNRSCSSSCVLEDIKNKTQNKIFDGNNIIYTKVGIEYKFVLNKKNVNVEFIEIIKDKPFDTTVFY